MHLDLKTPNILLARDMTAKLADVGLARIKRSDALTTLGGAVGTYVYAAPEVWDEHPLCLMCAFLSNAVSCYLGYSALYPDVPGGALDTGCLASMCIVW